MVETVENRRQKAEGSRQGPDLDDFRRKKNTRAVQRYRERRWQGLPVRGLSQNPKAIYMRAYRRKRGWVKDNGS